MAISAKPSYTPDLPPDDIKDNSDADRVLRWARREFDKLARAPSNTTFFEFLPLNVAPSKPRAGMVVYADGVNWNPGSGEGLYEYTIAGAWNFLAVPALSPVTKSDQQTGTNNTKFVTPLHQQDHDSAAKAWVIGDASGGILASYNVASVTKNATGDFTVTFTTAFATANYSYAATLEQSAVSNGLVEIKNATGRAAGSIRLLCVALAGTTFDPASWSITCFGRQ